MKIKTLIAIYIFIFPFFYFRGLKDILLVFIIISMTSLFIKKKRYKLNKQIFHLNSLLMFFVFFSSIISITYIWLNFEYSMSAVLHRFEIQLFRFIFILFDIYIGLKLFEYLDEKTVIKILLSSIILIVLLALYQNIAYMYNLPLWGLYFSHNEKFAIDSITGYRNSSLCGEPKYLSVYMAVAFFFVKDLSKKYLKKIFAYLLMVLILFVFLKTSSANGLLAFLILIAINIYLYSRKIFYVSILLIPILSYLFLNYYEYIIFRPSHLLILDAIMNSSIDMSYMDDLVYLPWLSWINFSFMLPLGYGLGLLHYYAANFIYMAKWFNLNEGYIDSNVALLSYISNFGIILILIVFIFFIYSMNKNLIFFKYGNSNILIKYSIYTFFVGLFIGGNITTMLFISIGIMLYYNNVRQRYKV